MGDKVGASTTPADPVGTGEKGNSGVAAVGPRLRARSATTRGSTSARTGSSRWGSRTTPATTRPRRLELVAAAALLKTVPSLSSLSSTNAAPFASDLSLVNPPYSKPKKGKALTKTQKYEAAAYPLATFTYVIVRPDDPNIADVKEFISFDLTSPEQAKGIGGSFAVRAAAVCRCDRGQQGGCRSVAGTQSEESMPPGARPAIRRPRPLSCAGFLTGQFGPPAQSRSSSSASVGQASAARRACSSSSRGIVPLRRIG